MTAQPPKPPPRPRRVSFWRHLRLFRRDILSAQPAHLFHARMAEFRTPFFRSFLINEPALIRTVLNDRPADFPKSARVAEGLRPLLGQSVFVTNGAQWQAQRRIIDPAFERGRLRDAFPAIWAAGQAAAARLRPGEIEAEAEMSHLAADVIFRTLFSLPIEHRIAAATFAQLRAHQRAQPVLNLGAFLRLPRLFPRLHRPRTRATARAIRALITGLTEARAVEIAAGRAPDDLATKIMTAADPLTGATFSTAEMVDQVAIFFLAGHETSASALAWSLYLLASHPEAQERAAAEALAMNMENPSIAVLSGLTFTRDVFREALRLYPPVPMMVREAARPERFRDRAVPRGAQIVISPWHLHRHDRLWPAPDAFDPDRWRRDDGQEAARAAYLPFSSGPRVCPGAGFAMVEGPVLLALMLRAFRLAPAPGPAPQPVAHLTVRARDGIRLSIAPRTA